MPTALIIGASRGIGLELARQYKAAGWRVIATARTDKDCKKLATMECHAYQLDVNSAESIGALGWNLDDEKLDVAFYNAGAFGPRDSFPTQEQFDLVMHTHVYAAMRILPVIAPLVCDAKGTLAVLSSHMGSIAGRSASNATLYRASKAALNSVLADTALEYGPKGATCIAVHPGWVKTDMGGPGAELEVDVSVAGMRTTLAGLSIADNGKFLNYDGTPIPW